ncbi:hypothetical protein BH10ACT6_BH10ACT6_13260 [soil metagenome]
MRVDDAVRAVARRGGIATTAELRAAGVRPDAINRAVLLKSTLIRPRRGIFALATAPPEVLRAIRAGGALAATSAAQLYGLWTPPDGRLHVSVRRDAHLSASHRVVYHRDAHHLGPSERFLVSRQSCVRQCIRFLPFSEAVAVLDSALHQLAQNAVPAIDLDLDLDLMRRDLPRRLHPVLDASDGRAEAGAESLARTRLAQVGVIATPQQWIASGIRVDLLIDDLVVEIGSREFHADPDQYEHDHARAALIVGLGFDYLEFTTSQVTGDWDTVEGVILRRIEARGASRQHSWATRRRQEPVSRVSPESAG